MPAWSASWRATTNPDLPLHKHAPHRVHIMPSTTTLASPRFRQGDNMHLATPLPQGPNQKRRFRLPHAHATRDRKHQKPDEIGGQGAQGRSLEESRNQVMSRIFDDLSDFDDEAEYRVNSGCKVTGVNAKKHAGGDDDHQNHSHRNRLPTRGTTKHAYNRRLHGNQWVISSL